MGLVCCLLAGESCGNLQTYCPQFHDTQICRRSHHLYSWDPADHLRFVNPCNFKTLDRVGWLQLLVSGIDFQATCYYRERLMAGALY